MLLSIDDPVSSVAQLLTVALIFLFVLVITWFTTRFIAGYQKNRLQTGNMELVESLRISNTKYLQIVRVGKRYVMMAVCKDSVTFLTELSEDELIIFQGEQTAALDFNALLDKARKLHPGNREQDTDEGK
ncbi:MAG: flagellar biosynthetic protein FliO [Lachnospiraceae bacterium]